MSTLLSLKEWVTLDEGASYLSGAFDESVGVCDLYRFCLSEHLRLSVNFVSPAYAVLGNRIRIRDAGFKIVLLEAGSRPAVRLGLPEAALPEFREWILNSPDAEAFWAADDISSISASLMGTLVSPTECIRFESGLSRIAGLWDLSLTGAERFDIEDRFQYESGGLRVRSHTLTGVVLNRPDGQYAQLQVPIRDAYMESEHGLTGGKNARYNRQTYAPATSLPDDLQLVVRSAELQRLVRDSSDSGKIDINPSTRERNTLLRIIDGLAKKCHIDISEGSNGAVQIEQALALAGHVGPKEKTIRDVLRKVRELD